jgi:hypothetical protein
LGFERGFFSAGWSWLYRQRLRWQRLHRRAVLLFDQSLSETPGQFGSIAASANGMIGPFAVAISIAISFTFTISESILAAGIRR